MAEILSAKCTICGKVFEGKDCVEKAEEHEKIPVKGSTCNVGDIIVNIDNNNYIESHIIKNIFPSKSNHEEVYNNRHNFDISFKIQTKEIEGLKTIDKLDLLNNPIYCDLRNKLVEIKIDKILYNILQYSDKYGIDKIFNYECED